MIVIASHDAMSVGANPIHNLAWIRSIVDQIADHPKLIPVLVKRPESREVGVNVRNDCNFHAFPRALATLPAQKI